MICIMRNNNRCNTEFKKIVDKKILELNKKGVIVCKVKFITNEFERYTGAIISYK